jgi:hypothetical protein
MTEFYSLGLDESTDITDVCQVMILVRKIDKNFGIKEEFLKLQPLTTGTKGSGLFEALNKVVSKLTSFEKCTGIVTDGAKSVVGSKTGLMGHLKQLEVKSVFLHCIVHQEALCSKIIKMNRTMKIFVNVNLIRRGNKLKDSEHSLHFWKKWMPIMVIFPYILTSDG